MTLTGLGFLALLVAVAAGLVAATMPLWNRWPRPLRRAAARGHGIVVSWTLPGARSKISRTGMVYLPAAYFDAHRVSGGGGVPRLRRLAAVLVPRATWQHAEAPALDWIGEHLGAPVAPASPEPGAVTLPPLTAPGPTPSP
jgi:hypothetical protein